MAKRAWQLAKGVYYELFIRPKPLPNPEWYNPPKIDKSPRALIRLIRRANKSYMDSWRAEFDDTESKQQEFDRTVKEQKQALKDISSEGSALATTSRDSMKTLAQDGIQAYRLSIKAFVEGYKEASSQTNAASIMDAFVTGPPQQDTPASQPDSTPTSTPAGLPTAPPSTKQQS